MGSVGKYKCCRGQWRWRTALELFNEQAMESGARRLIGDFEDWEVLLACLEWGCEKGRLEEEVTEVGVGVLGDLLTPQTLESHGDVLRIEWGGKADAKSLLKEKPVDGSSEWNCGTGKQHEPQRRKS